jgi:hypothetical protein
MTRSTWILLVFGPVLVVLALATIYHPTKFIENPNYVPHPPFVLPPGDGQHYVVMPGGGFRTSPDGFQFFNNSHHEIRVTIEEIR